MDAHSFPLSNFFLSKGDSLTISHPCKPQLLECRDKLHRHYMVHRVVNPGAVTISILSNKRLS